MLSLHCRLQHTAAAPVLVVLADAMCRVQLLSLVIVSQGNVPLCESGSNVLSLHQESTSKWVKAKTYALRVEISNSKALRTVQKPNIFPPPREQRDKMEAGAV